jgi:PDZ domain-containing protein
MNFVLITPGDPTPLFPKTLTLKGATTYPADGQLYLLTIMVTNPETKVLGAEVVGCWIWGDCAVMPRSVMYEDGTTNKEEAATGTAEMESSQSEALIAALSEISHRYPNEKVTIADTRAIKVNLKNTGGPSGGLIFAIGITEMLTKTDILQGRKIAGTGTITSKGVVGPIGGVTEKILGAKKAGASLLFISQDNCTDLPPSVEGISIVAVKSLGQALDYLQSPQKSTSASITGCRTL